VVSRHGTEAVFVDVRDTGTVASSGTIAGALNIPRGMLEFIADEESAIHNSALKKDAEIYLVCTSGGQAALAGKTLIDMGFTNVTNIGGVKEWSLAGGPVQG